MQELVKLPHEKYKISQTTALNWIGYRNLHTEPKAKQQLPEQNMNEGKLIEVDQGQNLVFYGLSNF